MIVKIYHKIFLLKIQTTINSFVNLCLVNCPTGFNQYTTRIKSGKNSQINRSSRSVRSVFYANFAPTRHSLISRIFMMSCSRCGFRAYCIPYEGCCRTRFSFTSFLRPFSILPLSCDGHPVLKSSNEMCLAPTTLFLYIFSKMKNKMRSCFMPLHAHGRYLTIIY